MNDKGHYKVKIFASIKTVFTLSLRMLKEPAKRVGRGVLLGW